MDAGMPPAPEPDYAEIRLRLLRSVRRVCPAWLRSRADDIVQEAMVRVLEIFRARESTTPLPSSYLWKVAYSATVDEIRRLRRRPEVSWDDAGLNGGDAAGPLEPADPEAGVAMGELGEAAEGCLATLPDARRITVGLHLLGFSAAEIAASMGWGEKSVRNLLHRGLVALRLCLETKGFSA
jgi:RNA polymerase sigma-70 factor (ECF subfamily)